MILLLLLQRRKSDTGICNFCTPPITCPPTPPNSAAALQSPTTSGLQTDDDCELMHSANYMAAPPPPPPPRLPALARARPTRSRPNTHMCVYIYTHMYTCIHMRGLRLLLPSPRLPASLHRVWPATMITRLTATSRLRQLCGRFYYFSIVMMILVCATFAFVNYVSALPPPALHLVLSRHAWCQRTIERHLSLRLLPTRHTNYCFRVVSLNLL